MLFIGFLEPTLELIMTDWDEKWAESTVFAPYSTSSVKAGTTLYIAL